MCSSSITTTIIIIIITTTTTTTTTTTHLLDIEWVDPDGTIQHGRTLLPPSSLLLLLPLPLPLLPPRLLLLLTFWISNGLIRMAPLRTEEHAENSEAKTIPGGLASPFLTNVNSNGLRFNPSL